MQGKMGQAPGISSGSGPQVTTRTEKISPPAGLEIPGLRP